MKDIGYLMIGIKTRKLFMCEKCYKDNVNEAKREIENEIAMELYPVLETANNLLSYN